MRRDPSRYTTERDAIIASVLSDMARDARLPGGGIVGRPLSDFHVATITGGEAIAHCKRVEQIA